MIRFKLKEKLFSIEDIIISQSNFFIRELIKIILLGDKCKNDIPHWIDNAIGAQKQVTNNLRRWNINDRPSLLFLGIVSTVGIPRIDSLKKKLINEDKESYIKTQFNEIYNQKDKGNPKYQCFLKPNLSKDDLKEIMLKLKYIALCFSGQLDPEIDNFYEINISRINIDFTTSTTSKDIRPLLENIIHEQFYL